MSNMNYGPSDDITVLEVSEFTDESGVLIERVVLDVHGHDVQIISHDHSQQVVVQVDNAIRQMDISNVDSFIRNRT